MDIAAPEKPLKTQYSGMVKSLVGKRDALTDLAEFIMHETNGQPLNISMDRVLEYIDNKKNQLNQGNNNSEQGNVASDTKMQTENVNM